MNVREALYKLAAAVALATAVGWLWVQASTHFWMPMDDNAHLYVVDRVLEGKWLYRDIQSSRPPLMLAPLLVARSMGLSYFLSSRIAVGLCVFGTALLIGKAVTRFSANKTLGLVAVASFFAFPDTTRHLTYTGIHLTAALSLACLYLTSRRRSTLAGVAAGLALLAGQHAAIICGVCGLATLAAYGWRAGLRFAVGFTVVFGTAMLGLLAAGVYDDFYASVIAQHLYHVGSVVDPSERAFFVFNFVNWLAEHAVWLLACPALVALRLRPLSRARWTDFGVLSSVAALAHVVVVAQMTGGLMLYLVPALPLIAIASALLLRQVAEFDLSKARAIGATVTALSLTVAGWAWAASRSSRYDNLREQTYAIDPWRRNIQATESQAMPWVENVARAMKRTMKPEESLFGEIAMVAPVALAGGLRISADRADFVTRWLARGQVSREALIADIEAHHVRYFITPRMYYAQDPLFLHYLEGCFRDYKVQQRAPAMRPGFGIPDIVILERRPGRRCIAPK